MTPEQKMQAVVEAAGECWHEGWKWHVSGGRHCANCNLYIKVPIAAYPGHNPKQAQIPKNPSPTDLNELFRLAEKLELISITVTDPVTGPLAQARKVDELIGNIYHADTPAEALLNALYEVTK